MYERFTGRARQAVILAQEEARQLRHRDIAVEHLLIGVARVAPPLVSENAEDLRQVVVARRAPEVEQPLSRLPLTRDAHAALVLADEEVVYRGHTAGGPAHLVLGLLNAAADEVRTLVRDTEQLRSRALELAETSQEVAPSDAESALRAGYAVPVIVGDGLPLGNLGTRTTDARVLLAMLAANGEVSQLLREHGLNEATVKAVLKPRAWGAPC